MTNWYIGTMGFAYKAWRGVFYPPGLSPRNYLAYYASRFNAVEMDSTFYGVPTAERVMRWTAVSPVGFRICPKTPRAITHDASLDRGIMLMQTFIKQIRLLGNYLGPILIQFPPNFTIQKYNQLTTFLKTLPPDLQFAIEFRHPSWEQPETAELLRQHNICQVTADYIYMPKQIHRTTNYLYLRFLGPHGQFADKNKEQLDKTAELKQWWQKIQPHLPHIHTIYAFFNNDYAGYSPATCNRFREIVGEPTTEINQPQQGRLF
ncbi:MAG: DUF72 domain-containing protein [Chloroflexi bacterium]|nr:MAG: DUF72 domain-containing protein [Chloroflexota bacterium]